MTSCDAVLGCSGGEGQDGGVGNTEPRSELTCVAPPQQGCSTERPSTLSSVHAAAVAPAVATEALSGGRGDADARKTSIHSNDPLPKGGSCGSCGFVPAATTVVLDSGISSTDPATGADDIERTPSLSELPAACPSPRRERPVCVMKPGSLDCALPAELQGACSREDVSPRLLLQEPCWTGSSRTNEPEVAVCPPTARLGQSPADQSLLPHSDGADLWHGWTVQTSQDGRLFYHHAESGTSQWLMPRELSSVLGEWLEVHDEAGGKFWRNELLGMSSWKDPSHATNLFQAALDGNLFFLQLYTEVGGFLDAVDPKGRTALHYNCASGSTAAVLHLLQRSASAHLQDSTGSTPLHWACRYSHAPIVRMLLEARCSPDVQNALGDTSLHEAAAIGALDSLHWLVHARGNPRLRNREERTPTQVAAHGHAEDVATLLRQHEVRHQQRRQSGAQHMDEDEEEEEEEDEEVAEQNDGGGAARPHINDTCSADTANLKASQQRLDRSRFPGGDAASSASEDGEETEPSLALVVVRAARPLLRGVQWLANRVLGERKTDLGTRNGFHYDTQSGQWVLLGPEPVEPMSDPDDSATSVASCTDEEPPIAVKRPFSSRGRVLQSDSEGVSGAV